MRSRQALCLSIAENHSAKNGVAVFYDNDYQRIDLMNKIELLAPAGNFECLVAAVQSGADAVYLSGKNFGARSFADNFDRDELEKAVDYCHLRGVRIYVTVNTLTKDSEMAQMQDYLLYLNHIGVDAIIVQDIGVVNL